MAAPDHQPPDIAWQAGDVPVSRAYDDPYYSAVDGLAESRHVFLAGNALPERFRRRPRFAIAELGFGTGLNFLAAWDAWRGTAPACATLEFTSFEIAPIAAPDMARALARWPDLAPLADTMIGALTVDSEIALPGARLRVVTGDARETVPACHLAADAWFLDGFAPARNPSMWEPALLSAVFSRTVPGGTAATYSAAGAVRRALAEAGFRVEKRSGFGRKRDMVVARRA